MRSKNVANQLNESTWLACLAFLADGSSKRNILNFQLQGTNENMADMISAVNAFESTLLL
jgi:hypothetical protein